MEILLENRFAAQRMEKRRREASNENLSQSSAHNRYRLRSLIQMPVQENFSVTQNSRKKRKYLRFFSLFFHSPNCGRFGVQHADRGSLWIFVATCDETFRTMTTNTWHWNQISIDFGEIVDFRECLEHVQECIRNVEWIEYVCNEKKLLQLLLCYLIFKVDWMARGFGTNRVSTCQINETAQHYCLSHSVDTDSRAGVHTSFWMNICVRWFGVAHVAHVRPKQNKLFHKFKLRINYKWFFMRKFNENKYKM